MGPLLPSDSFPQSTYVAWKTFQYSDCCKLISSRLYHNIPGAGPGVPGTHYDETTYGYDLRDRQTRVTSPGGTITWTVFDTRSLPIGVYIGTNDAGATENDPTGGGSDPDNNMVLVTENEYDDGVAGGDGNLTQVTQMVDDTTSRVTTFGYDWRNRRVTADGPENFFEATTYDNLDRVTRTERFDDDAAGTRLARRDMFHDDLGRVYQAINYAVNPSNGTVGHGLIDNFWFDPVGNPAKSLPSGSSLFTKTLYDSLNRPTRQYVGYDADETSYADIFSVTDDVILEQTEFSYDDASNVVKTVIRQRYHDAPDTQTGGLNGPDGPTPKARVTYR